MSRSIQLSAALVIAALGMQAAGTDQQCARCHAKEVAGYARSGMAKSLAPIGEIPAPPDATFQHSPSGTTFSVRSTGFGMTQSLRSQNESVEQRVAFSIGSGNHAFGYLVQVGDHVFQSPLSYYTNRHLWDVAPGYEEDPHPDFSRPITLECLLCHSGRPLPITGAQNRYQPSVFAATAISCDRCDGPAEAHLKNPVPGSIVNPSKLSSSARDSVCEQCHLKGEARIPNPGKELADYVPGQRAEDTFTTYVAAPPANATIKVVSHVEQLALSVCAKESAGKLWCGTCHNPHDKPVETASYYRARCLTCHAATLNAAHSAPDRDCVACHMPKQKASDGGHSVFTDHRIARHAASDSSFSKTTPSTITAWREPADQSLRRRNLALALVAAGTENQQVENVIRGYRMLNQVEKDFPDDPAVLTSLGFILLKAKQPEEALRRFQKVLLIRPDNAAYQSNAGAALLRTGHPAEAIEQLEKALAIDPLLYPAVQLLSQIYLQQGQAEKATNLLASYRQAMGIKEPVP